MGSPESSADRAWQYGRANALLQRKGARTAFVTNRGFGDMLTLAAADPPQIVCAGIESLAAAVAEELCLETGGRVSAEGNHRFADCGRPGRVDRKTAGTECRIGGGQSVVFVSRPRPRGSDRAGAARGHARVFVSVPRRCCLNTRNTNAAWRPGSTLFSDRWSAAICAACKRVWTICPPGSSLQVMQSSGETHQRRQGGGTPRKPAAFRARWRPGGGAIPGPPVGRGS